MSDHMMDVRSLTWVPPLIRLTCAMHPDMPADAPADCYIAPQYIIGIERRLVRHSKINSPEESHPFSVGTYVSVSSGNGYWVEEPPQMVAMLRDQAMGFEHKPRPV